MKNDKELIKELLREIVPQRRKKQKLTQEQMAEKLHITQRAYSDLERGKNCFSIVPLIFLLLQMDEDELRNFLKELRKKLGIDDNNDAA